MANKKNVPRGTMVMHLGNGKTAYGTGVIDDIPCITFEPLKESAKVGTFLHRDSDAYTGEMVILKLETKEAVYGLFRMLSRIMVEYDARDIKAFHESLEEAQGKISEEEGINENSNMDNSSM